MSLQKKTNNKIFKCTFRNKLQNQTYKRLIG